MALQKEQVIKTPIIKDILMSIPENAKVESREDGDWVKFQIDRYNIRFPYHPDCSEEYFCATIEWHQWVDPTTAEPEKDFLGKPVGGRLFFYGRPYNPSRFEPALRLNSKRVALGLAHILHQYGMGCVGGIYEELLNYIAHVPNLDVYINMDDRCEIFKRDVLNILMDQETYVLKVHVDSQNRIRRFWQELNPTRLHCNLRTKAEIDGERVTTIYKAVRLLAAHIGFKLKNIIVGTGTTCAVEPFGHTTKAFASSAWDRVYGAEEDKEYALECYPDIDAGLPACFQPQEEGEGAE